MASTIFLIASLVFFLFDACGKASWTFGSVTLHNLGFGLSCLVLAGLAGSPWPWKKQS